MLFAKKIDSEICTIENQMSYENFNYIFTGGTHNYPHNRFILETYQLGTS